MFLLKAGEVVGDLWDEGGIEGVFCDPFYT